MSKALRSKLWFVRFDGEKEFLRSKCVELSQCLDVVSMLAAYHVGNTKENPHTHFVIELSSEPQKQSFAVRLKKLFGLEQGNRNYALDVWDGDRDKGAVSYLFHEDTPLSELFLVNKGFTEAQISAASAANKAVQKVVAMNKEKASNKLVEKALTEFAGKRPDRLEILEYMLRLCHNGENHLPKEFCLKHYVEEVYFKLTPTREIWNYADALIRKWGY